MDVDFEKSSLLRAEDTLAPDVTLPRLNRGTLSTASIRLCELAIRDGWLDYVTQFESNEIGIYSICFESQYNLPEGQGFEPGLDIRTFLRKRISPSAGLRFNGALSAGALSILLKTTGPLVSFPHCQTSWRDAVIWASLDLEIGRTKRALFVYLQPPVKGKNEGGIFLASVESDQCHPKLETLDPEELLR